jgi:hypothetical protein
VKRKRIEEKVNVKNDKNNEEDLSNELDELREDENAVYPGEDNSFTPPIDMVKSPPLPAKVVDYLENSGENENN